MSEPKIYWRDIGEHGAITQRDGCYYWEAWRRSYTCTTIPDG